MSVDRLQALQTQMRDADVAVTLIGPGPDLRYLVGYHALPLERLTLLIVPAHGDASLVVPELEVERATRSGAGTFAELVEWAETDDPLDMAVSRFAGTVSSGGGCIAVQDRMWASFLLGFQHRVAAEWLPASRLMRSLRMIKTPEEIKALAAAGRAIDAVHAQVPSLLAEGRSERDIGHEIAELILVEHEEVNFVIVASGPHGASPHHETGDRRLVEGDTVVVDIGGTRQGYCSDITRNYALGDPGADYAAMHEVLEIAQRAALDAVRPGITAGDVDRAARDVLSAAGYGEAFIHRTGHGIGLEEHEEPWIVAGNTQVLREGMAFSIEPGVYLRDRYGARIEDIVVVGPSEAILLNHVPRSLTVVD
ncbi:MAG: Xaa-Pro peptidase family protein [Nitriliruptoraceae bacterium]